MRFASALVLTAATATAAAQPLPVPPTFSAAILGARRGAIVNVPPEIPLRDLRRLPVTVVPGDGPQFILSDKPEYFRVPEGAAIRETVKPGPVRIYAYHVNATTDTATKKIGVVVKNLNPDAPLTLRVQRRAAPPASGDYYAVGKAGLAGWFGPQADMPARVVPPGGSVSLDPAMESLRPKFDELVHLFADFTVDQLARVTVLQTMSDTSLTGADARITALTSLPAKISGAGSGLFPYGDTTATLSGGGVLDTAAGPVQVVVADGKTDPWITGRDDGRSTNAVNQGNYGVVYHVRLKRTTSDGRALALLMFNERTGGKWCDNMAAAVRVSKGLNPAGVVEVPTGAPFVTGLDRAVVVQVWPPLAEGESDEIAIDYSPPGASCLPTPFVFVPVDLKAPANGVR